jgi:hypothetical protein
MWEDVILLVLLLAGVAVGVLASRLPACGKAALALGLVSLAGFPVMVAFC